MAKPKTTIETSPSQLGIFAESLLSLVSPLTSHGPLIYSLGSSLRLGRAGI